MANSAANVEVNSAAEFGSLASQRQSPQAGFQNYI